MPFKSSGTKLMPKAKAS